MGWSTGAQQAPTPPPAFVPSTHVVYVQAEKKGGFLKWATIGCLGVLGLCVVFALIGLLADSDSGSTRADSELPSPTPRATARSANATMTSTRKPQASDTQPSRTSTPTPRPAPTVTPVPKKKPLEVLDITTKDAGLGDGTFYAYVDIINNSDQLYSYVGLDGTCRNANGQVVATGLGNTANLAPGERTTITVIFLAANGCARVEVTTDSLTNLVN